MNTSCGRCGDTVKCRLEPHISIAKSVYVYIRTGVATVWEFCTYIYVRKSERVNTVTEYSFWATLSTRNCTKIMPVRLFLYKFIIYVVQF